MARQFIDIGANLTDQNYQGLYHGKQKHDADLDVVLSRAERGGVSHIIITSGCLKDLKDSLAIIEKYQPTTQIKLSTTVGVHPTRTNELKKEGYLQELMELCDTNIDKIVAIGEMGLDYDRNAWDDMKNLNKELGYNGNGVVHCFDGSKNMLDEVLEAGWEVSVNALSFQTQERIDVMKEIPLEKLHFETDCPYCGVKRSDVSFKLLDNKFMGVKPEKYQKDKQVTRRNEPVNIIDVAVIMSKIKGVDLYEMTQEVYKNTMRLFYEK
ncbi:Hydrolase TatD family protein [Entamoeba marina]